MKSGLISIIGRPNAGKSTLLNHILKQKVAITSDKPQTTRARIMGIYHESDLQLVFIDTPGIHKPKHKLGAYMVETARESIYDGDLIYYMVDASVPFGAGEAFILDVLKKTDSLIFLLLNKVDKLNREDILRLIVQWQSRGDFSEIFPLSARTGDNVDRLLQVTKEHLAEGPAFFPDDMVTDQSEKHLMAELVREKILRLTEEEIPHSVAVVIEKMQRRPDDDKLEVYALVYVERNSQKRIIIGKNGTMMKRIGIGARKDIRNLLGEDIVLHLWVKVKENWRDRDSLLHDFGYDALD